MISLKKYEKLECERAVYESKQAKKILKKVEAEGINFPINGYTLYLLNDLYYMYSHKLTENERMPASREELLQILLINELARQEEAEEAKTSKTSLYLIDKICEA